MGDIDPGSVLPALPAERGDRMRDTRRPHRDTSPQAEQKNPPAVTVAASPSVGAAPPPGSGLSESQARARLAEDGPNELPEPSRRSVLAQIWEVLTEPMIALLLGAMVLYLIFGEPRDAVVLALSVVVVITLDLYQERRAERTLEALRDLTVPEAVVLRDGRRRSLPAREVVRGDWVAVTEGVRVVADGEIRSGTGLLADESLLTGESVPVRKSIGLGGSAWARPGGDDLPFVYAQTLVVRGQGWVEVRATGHRTEASRIATAIAGVETATPLIREQTRPLVLGVGGLAVALTTLLAVVVGLRSGDWILGLLAGSALAIGLLPEEIPVVTTVYSVLGARRMARHRALVRRFGTIPTLGCVTVLCTDKTGTVTLNRMRLSRVVVSPEQPAVVLNEGPVGDRRVRDLLRTAALAGEPEAVDPMEVAILEGAREFGVEDTDSWVLVEHVPFSAELKIVRNSWTIPGSDGQSLAVKGAPETVLDACGVPERDRIPWNTSLRALAQAGYRVLGVARGIRPGIGADPTSGSPLPPLEFLGLLGLADPLRPGVPEAVQECHTAGVRVLMITGDHPETARAIAREAGWPRPDPVLTGTEVDRLSASELQERVRTATVYARVRPEQKLRLVEALRANGEVVAMTGDGVNDAPALRAAHVGIAMGHRGTDVAREASSLVLLDDAFPTVVEAVRTGRRVYDNMRKALAYIVAVHVAIAGMAMVPVLLGFPILLFPVEIVFLELIIDPVSSLVFEVEREEPGLMDRPPRDPSDPLLGRSALLGSILLGASALVASLAVYGGAVLLGRSLEESRALGFAALIAGNLSMVFLCRSASKSLFSSLRVPNFLAWFVAAYGVGLLLLAIYLPGLSSVFQFGATSPLDLGIAIAVGAIGVLVNDVLKRRWLPESTVPPRMSL